MKHSEEFTAIAAALALAAAKFTPIKKNREVEVKTRSGGVYTFRYATLDAIVEAVRPALCANGLVLLQSVVSQEVTTADGVVREDLLETRLVHQSGEWFANLTPVLVAEGENGAQAYGSAITYARRYGITQLLCIVADEDEDGNAASGNVQRSRAPGSAAGAGSSGRGRGGPVVSEKQLAMLRGRLDAINGDEAALCQFMRVPDLESLPRSRVDDALAAIDLPEACLVNTTPSRGAGSKGTPAEQDRRKVMSDEAVLRNEESLRFIRYHLGQVTDDSIDLAAMEWGERAPHKAAEEWRALSEADQHALWLAPSHGGWFSTAERESLRAEIARLPTTTQES